jgi:hypothetical protein
MTAQDWVLIVGAIAAATVSILGAVGALWVKVHSYDQKVNGRMTDLLSLTARSSEAVGRLSAAVQAPRVQSDGPTQTPTTT